jgi:hypothetical protein
MRGLAAAVALLCWTGTAAAASPDWASLGLTAYTPPKAAPEFALPDLDGRVRTLGDARGKVLLLFFWTTW